MNSGHIDYKDHVMIVNWRGDYKMVDLNLIQSVTGIPISTRDQDPLPLDTYLPIMRPNCENPQNGGIKGTTTYRNIYAAGRWVCSNIIRTSHTSSFYEPTLHIIHCLMSNNYMFCMCKQLFSAICHSKVKLDAKSSAHMLLPCLITLICKTFISDQKLDDALDNYSTVAVREQISRGYSLCIQNDWTEKVHIEHIVHQQMEEMSDRDFWRRNNPIT